MASSRACPSRSTLSLLCACLAAALPAQQPNQQPDQQQDEKPQRPKDLGALFQQFRAMHGMSASYTEKKHLSLLAVPLSSSGALHYMTDADGDNGRLVRVVEKPEPSKLTVSEEELRIQDKRGTEVIDLRQSGRVRLFVTSLMQVFRGDAEALRRHYEVRFQHVAKTGDAWRLDLTPKQAPLDKILRSLSLRGRGEAVTEIVLTEPSGDRTVTTVTKADPRRTFTEKERLEIFGVRPAKAEKPRK